MFLYLILIAASLAHINLSIKEKKSFRLSSAEKISLSKKTKVNDYYALQYYADFKLGSPGQTISMILDTGSSYAWVPNINCSCHTTTHQFSASASSTYKNLSIEKDVEYGMGYIKGTLSTDVLSINGLKAEDMKFILVSQSSDLDGLAADGLVGLAFNSLSDGYPVFVEVLYEQNVIEKPVFSFYLGESSKKDSFITFGGLEDEYTKGKTKQIIDIYTDYGFWLSIIYSVSFDSNDISNSAAWVILDTGTSAIYGPSSDVQKILQMLKKKYTCYYSNLIICECSKSSCLKAGNLEFMIGNENIIITPENYLYCEDEYCWVLIGDSGDRYWLLGQPLFREYYTVHDMSIPQMELYRNKESEISYKVFWIILAIIILCGIGAFIVYYFLKNRNNENENENYMPLT
ncbi:hypothetical protein SteCoe_14021 [Stentor coeruleus]|uniref:Peptidase A1 domain-containing protein n=1 Tax=Stentor coeruleus TaxID=5963 RepID=A0A1R2C6X8_9CILI|nr:hypothetical protein SteCoe_14021 [Stentor coeruleus]